MASYQDPVFAANSKTYVYNTYSLLGRDIVSGVKLELLPLGFEKRKTKIRSRLVKIKLSYSTPFAYYTLRSNY